MLFSLLPTAALWISTILCYLCLRLFDVPLLLLCPLSALALHVVALLAASRIAATAVQLIPIAVVFATVLDAPLLLPPPAGCWQLPHCLSLDALLTS